MTMDSPSEQEAIKRLTPDQVTINQCALCYLWFRIIFYEASICVISIVLFECYILFLPNNVRNLGEHASFSLFILESLHMYICFQISVIKSLEQNHGVRIQIQKFGRINRILIEGRMEDNVAVITEINKILKEIEDEAKSAKHAEQLHKLVIYISFQKDLPVVC